MLYAIGDVHGCPILLRRLLERILADAAAAGRERPRVILLGDLVDRGPDARGVLDLLLSPWFGAAFSAVVLKGNHEQMLIEAEHDFATAVNWLEHGGRATVRSYGVEPGDEGHERVVRRFFRHFPDPHKTFLRTLPLSHREQGLFFCHAGVDPRRPLTEQKAHTLLWVRSLFTGHHGDFGARVVHGHTVTPDYQVEALANRIGVDTGCGFVGGRLSAAVIAPDGAVRTLAVRPPHPNALDG